ncbi:hypothetical protein BLNAU_6524 [Blattamonas nauphoetae]|nr:hypothetical protein BLNAU_6524 [Blattamonas nauphoetae]
MGIITDAVAIARILDIIVPETAAEMDYENLLNPSDDVYPSLLTHHTLILLFFPFCTYKEFHPFLLNIGPTWCVEYSGETYRIVILDAPLDLCRIICVKGMIDLSSTIQEKSRHELYPHRSIIPKNSDADGRIMSEREFFRNVDENTTLSFEGNREYTTCLMPSCKLNTCLMKSIKAELSDF